MKKISIISLVISIFVSFSATAFAHSVVKPNQVGVGAFQTFTLGVPSEKPIATTMIRLVIPEGLNHVTPNTKPGWTIETKKETTNEGARVSEIIWKDGIIPAEQRDEFLFSAQVPANETTINWKVYQSYADGAIISWDQDPKADQPKTADGKADFSKVGPLSQTKIVNDLTPTTNTEGHKETKTDPLPKALSIAAIALAILALARSRKS